MPAPLARLVDRWRADLLPKSSERLVVAPAARAYLAAGLASKATRPLLAVVPGERDAEDLVDDLSLFTEHAVLLPAWETLPFEHVSPNVTTMAARTRARDLLAVGEPGLVVVASVRAVSQRISPSSVRPIIAAAGKEAGFDLLVERLAEYGYHRTDRVESRGEFSVRGGLIDVFPAQGGDPVRLEFWGDEVESARNFSIGSQRSTDSIEGLVAYPARELRPDPKTQEVARSLLLKEPWAAATFERIAEGHLFAGMESWLPWIAPERTVLHELAFDAPVVVFDPVRAADRSRDLVKEETELAAALAPTWGHGAPEAGDHPALYLDLDASLAGRELIEAPAMAAGPTDSVLDMRALDATPGDADSVASAINRWIASGIDVVIAMDGEAAAGRVARLLREAGLDLPLRQSLDRVEPAVIGIGIHHGFMLPQLKLAVLGEQSIAGRRRAHRRVGPRREADDGSRYRDLTEGDYVVHFRHGIGKFEGLATRTIAGIQRDYLVVTYAAEDRLYVPTDQLAAVKKYTGGETPRLSRMGGSDWSKTKSRIRKEVAAVAEQVVALHRARAAAEGHSFSPDTPWQGEMEAAFPFEETTDQITAIDDVKQDMESDKPMDRLIFGDVGFGKTEVGVRASFKAVMEGKQVAVLCPTTLLAQQHFQVFSDRFDAYPIRVEMLSRFLTAKQQRDVVAKLATGEVDVVIGTHRLLSQDIEFKKLGLLVIDEEQRFGVKAKDQIKRFRIGVDVMTLTATPIPRTLEMALTGIRDVSHIRTAPEDRHPILTYVGPFDDQAVSAAIRREMLREGQVFYVHNRVQSIDRAVARLQQLVPNARYAIAHGQMSEGQLEQVMLDFWSGQYDVLVATTIIESGLDLPQVNTLIVERADLLGLAQLYQLRGRVGRSNQRAYAYLFHPQEQSLSEDAYRRLEAIGEHSDLGSGFHLAIRDLEIRGAGSMLGEVQSGHISAVGFDLYTQLVAEAVGELEGKPIGVAREAEVRIDLPVDAHLPEEYIEDQLARIEAYRRLAAAATVEAVDDVVTEWDDRYGPLPPAATALIDIARLRSEAVRIGLTEIVKLRNEVRLGPVDLSASQEVRLQRIAPRSVLKAAEGSIFLPAPADDQVVAKLIEFIRTMWPVEA